MDSAGTALRRCSGSRPNNSRCTQCDTPPRIQVAVPASTPTRVAAAMNQPSLARVCVRSHCSNAIAPRSRGADPASATVAAGSMASLIG